MLFIHNFKPNEVIKNFQSNKETVTEKMKKWKAEQDFDKRRFE